MKKLWIIVSVMVSLGLLVFAIAIGCAKVTKTSVSGGSEYFPHEDTYSWRYNHSESTTGEVTETKATFTGTASVDSISAQIFTHEYNVGTPSAQKFDVLYKVTDTAVLQYGLATSPMTDPLTYLAFPLEVGKSWMMGGTKVQVVAIETVTVPAGTFNNCFKISYPSTGYEYSYTWLAPNVGRIKRAESYQGDVWIEELFDKSFQ